MDLQIRTLGARVTDGMLDYVNGKMDKIDRMLDHIVDAQLELRTTKLRAGNELTTAQFTLQSGKTILRSEVRDEDASKAIDQAIDKLERQVRKFNDRKKNRRRNTSVGDLSAAISQQGALDGAVDDTEPEDRIVRTKRFSMKPMDVEEAIDQLELLGHDFYFFLNESENQFNVVYARRDGSYGLLGPDPI